MVAKSRQPRNASTYRASRRNAARAQRALKGWANFNSARGLHQVGTLETRRVFAQPQGKDWRREKSALPRADR